MRIAPLLVLAVAGLLACGSPARAGQPPEPGASAVPAAGRAQAPEVLSEVRVHGNYATPDEAVLKIAGLSIGQAVTPDTLDEVARRLESSGRFADVEVRKRYRSLTAGSDVTVVIVVTEYDAASPDDEDPTKPPSLSRRLGRSVMFLPVLDYTDGYGFTYGARFTFAGALGRSGRLSVPLTWGGTKAAVAEFEHGLPGGLFDTMVARGGWWRRENPHYDTDEDRVEVGVRFSKQVVRGLRAGIRAGIGEVDFGGVEERVVEYGADLTVDTRVDPAFPRNAVLATVAWDGTSRRDAYAFNRYRADAHGYLGVVGPAVLAVSARYETSDRPLPAYAQPLLGGAETLRGFRAGAFANDNLLAASAELRVPFTSPLRIAHTGVAFFGDMGTTYAHGTRLQDADFSRGFGAGFFVNLPVGGLRVDVAHAVGGGNRAHVTLGVRF